ncbi:hypothetical protein BGX26_000860, partial [Mortierella sp. AD094]
MTRLKAAFSPNSRRPMATAPGAAVEQPRRRNPFSRKPVATTAAPAPGHHGHH